MSVGSRHWDTSPSGKLPDAPASANEQARQLFSGERLRLARELRGMSQTELARAVGITSAALSQFEQRDGVRPRGQRLASIAAELSLPVEFFAARPQDPELAHQPFFRSLRSTPAGQRKSARAQAFLVHWLTSALERHVRLPRLELPRHFVGADAEREEVEAVAAEVRREWGLPAGRMDHVVRELERHGIVTARLDVGSDSVDAFSVPFPERPVVILGSDKRDSERSRFDAAHELGHLVMHLAADSGDKRVEQQAHQFAAAFLMPAEDIRDELPAEPDLRHVYHLKGRWGVSMAALLMRARSLGVMSSDDYVRAMKQMSARGWRKSEPGASTPAESPALLVQAVNLMRTQGVALEDLAAEDGLPLDDLNELLGAATDPRPHLEL
jgi:Zn-dependent peptidase ImmA (M78 family)/transcriptional regulator with XRE-family HTH domain